MKEPTSPEAGRPPAIRGARESRAPARRHLTRWRSVFGSLPIRAKVLGGTALVLLLSWVFVLLYYPGREERAALQSARERAASSVQMLALAVGVGLELNDLAAVGRAVEWAKRDSALTYAIVLDTTGTVFASYNPRH